MIFLRSIFILFFLVLGAGFSLFRLDQVYAQTCDPDRGGSDCESSDGGSDTGGSGESHSDRSSSDREGSRDGSSRDSVSDDIRHSDLPSDFKDRLMEGLKRIGGITPEVWSSPFEKDWSRHQAESQAVERSSGLNVRNSFRQESGFHRTVRTAFASFQLNSKSFQTSLYEDDFEFDFETEFEELDSFSSIEIQELGNKLHAVTESIVSSSIAEECGFDESDQNSKGSPANTWAKLGLSTGIAFTPANDLVDLTELFTGKDVAACLLGECENLNVSDRVLSAVGLVVGSGVFYRKAFSSARVGLSRARAVAKGIDAPVFDQAARHLGLDTLEKLLAKEVPGVSLKTTVFRFGENFKIHAKNVESDHRYSAAGFGAVYIGSSVEAVIAELGHYVKEMPFDYLKRIISKEVKLDNLLDLTNPEVRRTLGIELESLVRKKGDSMYDVTQAIGSIARNQYDGIIVPSARLSGATNIVVFKDIP